MDMCTLCEEGFYLNEYTGLCECMKGFKLNLKISQCEKCYSYSGECLFDCPENTVKDDEHLVCLKKEFDILENNILIWICFLTLVLLLVIQFLSQVFLAK